MSRISRQSMRVLAGLAVCCVLGFAVACSDSNNVTTGEAAAVEAAPPADEAPAAEDAAPADEAGATEEAPAPEEGAAPGETAPPEAAPNS